MKLLVAQFSPGFVQLNSALCTLKVNPVIKDHLLDDTTVAVSALVFWWSYISSLS